MAEHVTRLVAIAVAALGAALLIGAGFTPHVTPDADAYWHAAQRLRDGLPLYAVGSGDETLRMEYVSGDVQAGDAVVTSGIDGIYPKGFVIGQIESVDRGAGIYKVIRVRPAVDFSRLEEVLIVLTPPPTAEAGEGPP